MTGQRSSMFRALAASPLARDGSWVAGGQVAVLASGLLIHTVAARHLDVAGFAGWLLVSTAVPVFATVALQGLPTVLTSDVAAHPDSRARLAVTAGVRVALVALAAALVLVAAMRLAASSGVSGVPSPATLLLAGVWVVVDATRRVPVVVLQAVGDFRRYTVCGDALMRVATALVLLVVPARSVEALVATAASVAAASLLVAVVATVPHLRGRWRRTGPLGWSRRGWPLLGTDVVSLVVDRADVWLIAVVLSADAVALYGASAKVALLLAVPVQLAAVIAVPRIAAALGSGGRARLSEMLGALAAVALAATSLGMLAVSVSGGWLLDVLFGEFYRQGWWLLVVLAAGQVVNVATGTCAQVLRLGGEQALLLGVTSVTAMLTLLGAWVLAPAGFVAVGATFAAGVAARNVVLAWLAWRRLGVRCWPSVQRIPNLRSQ